MNMHHAWTGFLAVLGLSFGLLASAAQPLTVDPSIETALRAGKSVSVIVLLDDAAERASLAREETNLPELAHRGVDDYSASMDRRAQKFSALKQGFLTDVAGGDLVQRQDYRVLPVLNLTLKSLAALERLKAHPKVKSIDVDKLQKKQLIHSRPLIGVPATRVDGYAGAGTSVCVLDSSLASSYFSTTNTVGDPAVSTTPFVMCTQGLNQRGCNVLVDQLAGAATGSTDPHGTNVSGVVLGVAPLTKIVFLGVFSGTNATNSDTIAGIDYCIANKAANNTVAMNMSLGDGTYHASPVPTTDAYGMAIASAIGAGITTVVAAGNGAYVSGVYTPGLALPAAYAGVVSVGAVYSAAWGNIAWVDCTDTTTTANQVTCFSQSASFLTLLAPGAKITSVGIQDGGTSQATPHVAGAVALLKSAHPDYSQAQIVAALQKGPLITDPKSGFTNARLDLRRSLPAPQIAAGDMHTCALTSAGGVECWGNNASGQLGNGTTTSSTTPVPVTGLTSGVVAVATGWNHSCALLNSTMAGSTVMCWGDNSYGELGNGTNTSSSTPVGVTGLASANVAGLSVASIALSAGAQFTCIVTASEQVVCWGLNSSGQLGNGTTTNSNVPVLVSSITSATSVWAGYSHTCGVGATGAVACWGDNSYGELGNGTTTSSSVPVQVTGLTSGIVGGSSGWYHTCVVNVAGSVGCWGQNTYGQLGNGGTAQALTPVQVSGLTSGVIDIGSGQAHSCALTNAGSVQCWGAESYVASGSSFTVGSFSTTPFALNGTNGVVQAIAMHGRHACDRTQAGVVECWGDDSSGQLGNTAPSQTTPVHAAGPAGNGFLNVLGLAPPPRDFNGDGFSDLLWKQASTGSTVLWLLDGSTIASSHNLGGSSDWSVTKSGDFNGDGNSDLIWRQASTGTTVMWLMNGSTILSSTNLGTSTDWSVTATGDFNGDGKTDLIWRSASTGATVMWLMNGSTVLSSTSLGGSLDWSVTATGDFNGDGKTDLLWRQASTGAQVMWFMNGSATNSAANIGGSTDWSVTLTGDFNGDGYTDLLWRQASTGSTVMWLMNGATTLSTARLGGSTDWSAIGTGDFNGDGKTDLIWRQASTGSTVMWQLNGSSILSSAGLGGSNDWAVTTAN